jgi:transcription initiation factor TFIID TATA-box-binding protein
MQHPVISNVIGVGVLEMGFKLDLQLVACKMEGSRLNLKKFPGLVIRKIKPKGTILLFKSGKFIVVGAESEECGHVVSRKLCKDLQKILNIPAIKNKSFRISNIIAHGNLGYRVNISRIA